MNSQNTPEDGGSQEPQPGQAGEGGHSGEGAASAMQQLISQNKRHRHQAGEADENIGGGGQ